MSYVKTAISAVTENLFSYTGLKPDQTKALAEKAHIYMTSEGRISMAGLNVHNIDYFSESVSKAVKGDL